MTSIHSKQTASTAISTTSTAFQENFQASNRIRQLLNKPKIHGCKDWWNQVYRKALFETMVALVKESKGKFIPLLGTFIEFIQILAYLFPHVHWGSSGAAFGDAIRYVQFEVIYYTIFGLFENSKNGWSDPLTQGQTIAMACLLTVALILMACMVGLAVYVFSSFASQSFAVGVGPLRILRLLVSILCGVLYIPVLNVFLSSAKIGTTTGNPAFAVFGIIGAVVSIPFCFLMAVTYFNPNPLSTDIAARLDPTLEGFEMVLRTLVVILDVAAPTVPLARTISLLVLATISASFLTRRFPYFTVWVNFYLFTLKSNLILAALFAVGLSSRPDVADSNTAQHHDYEFWIYLGLVAFVSTGAWYGISRFYQKKIELLVKKVMNLDQQAVKEGWSEEDIEKRTSSSFEHYLASHQFKSIYEVELATRFLKCKRFIDSPCNLRQSTLIATAILKRGLAQFPKSGLMLALSGIFYGSYRKDYSSWRQYLDEAQKQKNNFFVGLMIHQSQSRLDIELRKSKYANGQEMDLLDIIEIQNSLKIARNCAQKIRTEQSGMWKLLLTGKVDPNRIQKAISKIYANEIAAETVLKTCAEKYYDNPDVIGNYAKFLEDIKREYDDAEAMWEISGDLSDKVAKQKTDQNHFVSLVGLKHGESRIGPEDSGDKSKILAKQNSKTSVSESVTSSHITVRRTKLNISAKELRMFKEYKKSIEIVKGQSIPRLKLTILVCCFVFVIGPLIQLIWISESRASMRSNIRDIGLSGDCRETALDFPLKLTFMREYIVSNSSAAKNLNVFVPNFIEDGLEKYAEQGLKLGDYVLHEPSGYYVPIEFAILKDHLLEDLQNFQDSQFELFFKADEKASHFKKWIRPSLEVRQYMDIDLDATNSTGHPVYVHWDRNLNFFDASTEFVLQGGKILKQTDPIAFFLNQTTPVDLNPYWRFVFDNFAQEYATAFTEITMDYTTENHNVIQSVLDVSWIILGVSAVTTILVGGFVVKPAIDKVFRQFDLATAALLSVSKTDIEDQYAVVMSRNQQQKSGKKNALKVNRSSKHAHEEALEEKDENNTEAEDEDDDLDFGKTVDTTSSSRNGLYTRYTLEYSGALLLIIALFSALTLGMYFASQKLGQWGYRAELSLRARSTVWKVCYDAQMLIVNDIYSHPDLKSLQDDLRTDAELFENVLDAALYGNISYGVDEGRIPDKQIPNLYEKNYVDGTMTAADLVSVVLESARALTTRKLPIGYNEQEYLDIMMYTPMLIDAFGKMFGTNEELLLENLRVIMTLVIVMFSGSCGLVLILYYSVFRPIISGLDRELSKAQKILLEIPLQAVKTNYPLQVLLRGPVAAKELMQSEEFAEVFDIDENGYPTPKYDIANISYVNQVVHASMRNLLNQKLFKKSKQKELGLPDKQEKTPKGTISSEDELEGTLEEVKIDVPIKKSPPLNKRIKKVKDVDEPPERTRSATFDIQASRILNDDPSNNTTLGPSATSIRKPESLVMASEPKLPH